MSETYEPIDEHEKEYRDEYLHDEPEKDRETKLEEMDERMHVRLAKAICELEDKLLLVIKQFFSDVDDDLDFRLEDAMDDYELKDKPLWKIEFEKESIVDCFVDGIEDCLHELISERIKNI